MLSQNNKKFIWQLRQKKFRTMYGMYVVEGEKIVYEALQSNSVNVEKLFFTKYFSPDLLKIDSDIEFFEITSAEMKAISQLNTPSFLLAIIRKPLSFLSDNIYNDTVLAFDCIQDPGNLGTIIRTADWFGIKNIICSKNSVDVFNSKVVQSSMGGIFRVSVFYEDLPIFLEKANLLNIPVYGTYLEGKNIYHIQKTLNGIIVFGNESTGISKPILKYINSKITIPNASKNDEKMESLNVGSSVAIVCSEISRRNL